MDGNKSVTARFAATPVLSAPASVSADFDLSATYAWSGLSDGSEYYEFQISSTSAASGYSQLYRSPDGTRTSPYAITVHWEAADQSGAYYFRVRVNTPTGLSPWSNVVTVQYTEPSESEVTLNPTADNLLMYSSTDAAAANTVYANSYLGIGQNFSVLPYGTDVVSAQSALQFSLPSSVTGRTILEATLRLYVVTLPADWNTVYRCGAIAEDWSTTTITYANAPNVYNDNRVDVDPPSSGAVPLEIDVTAIVRNWANGGWTNRGLLLWDPTLTYPSSTAYRATQFYQRESSSGKPELYIRYQ